MAFFHNPMFEVEPFEESQGAASKSPASPDDLKAFYQDMERKEIIERKLSKRKSGSGTSIWSRRSLKKSATAAAYVHTPVARSQPPAPAPPPETEPNLEKYEKEEEKAKELVEEEKDKIESSLTNLPRSIIPDSLREVPAWYNKEKWATIPLPSLKTRYPLYNPVGPKWYKNHHLIPPSQLRRAARPPSVFSPSFPPMASATLTDRPEDEMRIAASRSPSGSPLPTPSSSQTRVEDPGLRPRSRKTSQTAHDNVDLLDVTDPWGTNWHHQSPYDIGLSNGPVSVDVQEQSTGNSRSLLSSTTMSQNRSRTVIPSPLSQSTSAIHLETPGLPRQLSKGRSHTSGGHSLGDNAVESQPGVVSLPATPLEPSSPPRSFEKPEPSDLAKRVSAPPASLASHSQSSPKKDRRTSVLTRLAKRFSILKNSTGQVSRHGEENRHLDDAESDKNLRHSVVLGRKPSPEKSHTDHVKRIPPPSIEPSMTAPNGSSIPKHTESGATSQAANRSSLISLSLGIPFSIGKLTIANPDTPKSETNTLVQRDAPSLPPLNFDSVSETQHRQSREQIPAAAAPVVTQNAFVSSQRASASASPPPATSSQGGHNRTQSTTISPPPLFTEKAPPPPPQKSPKSPTPPLPLLTVSSSRGPTQTLADAPLPERTAEKAPQTTPPPAPPKPKAVHGTLAVPFPAAGATSMSQVPTWVSAPSTANSWDHSPLSAASMLVNPPTPYASEISMPASDLPSVPVSAPPEGKRSSRDPSPSGQAGASRKTETFRLVRTSSGNVYASGQTISAEGEQWEVVESTRSNGKDRSTKSRDRDSSRREQREVPGSTKGNEKERSSKSRDRDSSNRRDQREVTETTKGNGKERSAKPKERDTSSRKEHRRLEKTKADTDSEVEQRLVKNERSQRRGQSSSSSSTPRATSLDTRQGRPNRESLTSRSEEPKPSRRRDADKNRTVDRKSREERSTTTPNVNKPQPPCPPSSPGPPQVRPLERQPSTSARPTSELPLTAELNALRAREAWEMERLWKARSMYGIEPSTMASTAAPVRSSMGATSVARNTSDPSVHAAVHGSSHTSFMVQTPFQSQPSHIYHSMPAAPPPIIYASTPSLPQGLNHSSIYSYPNAHRSFISSTSSPDPLAPSSTSRAPLVNPLPEPPRESTYEPSPLPPTLLDTNNGRSPEYWKLGPNTQTVTTAH